MNRRNFIGNILIAGTSFAVLPPASTYGRIWKAQRQGFWAPLNREGLTLAQAMSCTQGMTTWEWFRFQMDALDESRVRTLRNWKIT